MKNIIFQMFLILSISVISAFAQPKIEILGGDTYNWGEIRPNQSPLRAKVQLKNVGKETLKIN
jgi:hypothetical protein